MKKNTDKPLVSIVILNWNGLEDTKLCLQHVRKLDYPNYEIVVVDNGSRQDQKDYLSKVKDIVYVDNPVNRGFTGGHIDGLAHASGDFILLLNNDAVVAPDYISQAMPLFEDPSVAVVGGRAYFWNDIQPLLNTNNNFYSYLNINPYSGEGIFSRSDYSTSQEVNSVSGSSVIVRRSVIDEVGYLYDPFFAYFEETDLFARIKRAGYRVMYNPDLHIWHRISGSTAPDSPFVYYQLFRNRFIFAVRNFESAFLWRFYAIYAKLALGSLARVILKPSANPNMHRSYVRAAAYSFFHLPQLLRLRRQLTRELGPSTYNHQLYAEQQGISVIVDATKLDTQALTSLTQQLGQNGDPQNEYVVVTTIDHSPEFDSTYRNVRFVTDRRYFASTPLTLGCLAARFDWMVIARPGYIPSTRDIRQGIAGTLGKRTQLIRLTNQAGDTAPSVILHKQLFDMAGGLGKARTSFGSLLRYLIAYATELQQIDSYVCTDNTAFTPLSGDLSNYDRVVMGKTIRYDEALLRSQHVSRLDRLRNRYYRLYQFSTLMQWLVIPKISLRLKAARLKNLVMYSLTLRPKLLATELRHIRNEVMMHSGVVTDLDARQKAIKARIAELKANPHEIPVFIICRDRVEPTKQLVAWLEKHGMKHIIFIDNDSAYPPLVEYLGKTPYQVLRLFRNVGHTSPWKLNIVRSLVPDDFYIVTDPDVIPVDECPADFAKHFLDLHKRFFAHQKVGFGLRIDDLPDHYPPKKMVIDWENQFWRTELEPAVYEAGVDTTFAMYKPYTYFYTIHPSLRTGLPYAARHLPWYTNPKKVSAEDVFYHARADQNVNSWNAEALADRYVKELDKNAKAEEKAKAATKTAAKKAATSA